MHEVLLINTSFPRAKKKYSSFGPPLGILSIASSLSRAGYRVTFVDPQVEQNYVEAIDVSLKRSPLYVGMSSYFGCNLKNAIEFSRLVKATSPGVPVVWGGPIASSLPVVCLTQAAVDIIVMGTGEQTAVWLADALRNGDHDTILKHPNLSVKRPDGIHRTGENFVFEGDLDRLPRIDLGFWAEGIRRMKSIPIMTSRGCPRRCAFCYNTFTGKGKYLLRSAPSVIDEMRHWHEQFRCSRFQFMDDNFLIDEGRATTILDAARDRGWEIGRVYGHLSDFRPGVLRTICDRQIGVTMCIESGSPRIRKLLNKHINIDRALALAQTLTTSGASFTTAFMFGLPGEEDVDIRQSIELAARLRDVSARSVTSMYYVYAPQPSDDVIATSGMREKIDFSLDALSNVEVVPVPPDDIIDLRLRPWMNKLDTQFYIKMAQVWMYHFDHGYRESNPSFDVAGICASNQRLSALFHDISTPPAV